MANMRLGSGARYKRLISKLEKQGVDDPAALAAHIGMAKYGKSGFLSLASKGRRRSQNKKTTQN